MIVHVHSLQLFQEFDDLMKATSSKKTIKAYNKLARVFVEYEMLYHQAWAEEVSNELCTVLQIMRM